MVPWKSGYRISDLVWGLKFAEFGYEVAAGFFSMGNTLNRPMLSPISVILDAEIFGKYKRSILCYHY